MNTGIKIGCISTKRNIDVDSDFDVDSDTDFDADSDFDADFFVASNISLEK